MSGQAITARGLSKRFLIGGPAERPTFLSALRRAVTGRARDRELWALDGVDLSVERGEALGVIGANGAGKSTLLLLLAGILAPTRGQLEVRGKADPFFQFGAGLQPRLTVRENFALCAALLGMGRDVLSARWRDILDFSGLEPYLDADYGELSTGLAARLPIAAAVHADLDIVLVDEMLSVGDRAFRQRCLDAFRSLRRARKTFVIASHDMSVVQAECTRVLYLRAGRTEFLGDPAEAVARFQRDCGG